MSNVAQIKQTKKPAYMNLARMKEFHTILSGMLGELETAGTEEIDCQQMPDVIDIASMQENAMLEMRRHERNILLSRKIKKSLRKIEAGEYGYCDECGGEIGIDRLHARPTADLCISCKTIAEQRESQFKRRRAA